MQILVLLNATDSKILTLNSSGTHKEHIADNPQYNILIIFHENVLSGAWKQQNWLRLVVIFFIKSQRDHNRTKCDKPQTRLPVPRCRSTGYDSRSTWLGRCWKEKLLFSDAMQSSHRNVIPAIGFTVASIELMLFRNTTSQHTRG